MGRSWSNQSTMFLLSPCPSGKCSVEVPAWPHSAELPQHHGSSSQSSGSAPWAVQHGWSHGADVVESISNVSPVALSLGKVFCRGAGLASQCRVGLLRGSLGIVVASTEARCSRKVVVLGEPFLGVSAAPCMGQVPKHPEVHPGLFNTVGAMGRSWSNQSAMFLLSPCPSGKCSVEVPAWPHSAELVCCGDPSELSCLLLWHVLHGRLWCSVNPSWAYMQSTKGRKSHNLPTIGGAACLPTHLGGSGWRAMGLPPSAPASFPKHAGAFFHGDVGNSTESKIVHAESRSYVSRFWLVQRKNVGIS
ncbi:hypothetical protein Lal_00043466 [Lupinus albus]|nr:hypothetical protein Lal_00043466 [Lupinus albus]